MRDLHRNPILYYVLIPVLIGLWPLLVWAVYLPAAKQNVEADCQYMQKAVADINEILVIDPSRTDPDNPNRVTGEFAYGKAVDRVANLCAISAKDNTVTAGLPITVGGKKRQDATVKLQDVSIVQVAKFLSTIQSTWVNLQCDQIKLTKRKGMPDKWDVDCRFIYYY